MMKKHKIIHFEILKLWMASEYSKYVKMLNLKKDRKMVFKTSYRLMQVKIEHSAIRSTLKKLPFVIKLFVLSIFEWLFYTGITECQICSDV